MTLTITSLKIKCVAEGKKKKKFKKVRHKRRKEADNNEGDHASPSAGGKGGDASGRECKMGLGK